MAKEKRPRKYRRHSPAGYAYLMEQQRATKPVYFKGIRKPTVESQLRRAGLSEADLARLSGKRLKRKKR